MQEESKAPVTSMQITFSNVSSPTILKWRNDYFSVYTFNQCSHNELPGMTDPEINLHVLHTPAQVPLH